MMKTSESFSHLFFNLNSTQITSILQPESLFWLIMEPMKMRTSCVNFGCSVFKSYHELFEFASFVTSNSITCISTC